MTGRTKSLVVRKISVYFGFAALTAAVAYLGSRYNPGHPDARGWYDALEKPAFTPPDWLFAPVWTALYAMIAASGARVFLARRDGRDETSRKLALGFWLAQMALNAAWSPLFFGKKDPRRSLLDMGGLIASIGAYGRFARRVDQSATLLMVPYLVWTMFAGALNEEIWRRNRASDL